MESFPEAHTNAQPTLPQLSELDGDTILLSGGKAATLARLSARGFRIPLGFVVTKNALDQLHTALDAALRDAVDRLGRGPFAVRSSAAAEDLPDASYAGLYETYLNIDSAGLADAVRRCFASAASARVTAYHTARASDAPVPAGMAVLVQQMIDPAAAGVAFTANPVTGNRDETVVTAVHGLAEALVSGEATGEEWTIRDGHASRTRAGNNPIDENQALAVADLAAQVAGDAGMPQDIEWAIDKHGVLYLIQARPMTALLDAVDWTPPEPGLWMRNFRIGEWLPEAMTPLFSDWLVPRLEAGYLGGMRETARVSVPFRYATINGWYYNSLPTPSPKLLLRVLLDSHGRAPWFLYNALARVSSNPAAADRAVLHDLELHWREEILPEYRKFVEAAGREVDTTSLQRVVAIIDEVCRIAGRYLFSLAIVGGSAWKMEGALARFWKKHLAGPLAGTPTGAAGHQVLLRGLPGAEPTFPPHAVYSLDWYQPTAGEMNETTPQSSNVVSPRATELAETRAAAEQSCRAALADLPHLLARFNGLLAVTQRYAVIREEQARDLTLGWPLLRHAARRLGELLQAADVIDTTDDIFFVPLGALGTAPANYRDIVRERRAAWRRQRHLPAPLTLGTPRRLIGDPIARAVATARGDRPVPDEAILGQPASAGHATGRVRIITGPADFAAFQTGEILVAGATALAWTPLFARAAAVVTDGGTLAAHASLVAREYGIPAVVGTEIATARLHTGQLVTVDGTAGTVLPIELS